MLLMLLSGCATSTNPSGSNCCTVINTIQSENDLKVAHCVCAKPWYDFWTDCSKID
jgi:hypothetical protein